MRHLLMGVLAVAFSTVSVHAKSIRIYTQKVDADIICGSAFGKYACSTTPAHMYLQKADIALTQTDGIPDYLQVLGMTYSDLTGVALSQKVCGSGSSNVFTASDLSQPTPANGFTYLRKSETSVSASLAADVKEALVAAGVPPTQLSNLEASFKSSYKNAAGNQHALQGSYYRVALSPATLLALKDKATALPNISQCQNFLNANDGSALIYSIAVIKLDKASFSSNLATEIAADFVAKVKAKAPKSDLVGLTAAVKNSVDKTITVALGTDYRVISWDYLTPAMLQ